MSSANTRRRAGAGLIYPARAVQSRLADPRQVIFRVRFSRLPQKTDRERNAGAARVRKRRRPGV